MIVDLEQLLAPGDLIAARPLVPASRLVSATDLVPADPSPLAGRLIPPLRLVPALLPATMPSPGRPDGGRPWGITTGRTTVGDRAHSALAAANARFWYLPGFHVTPTAVRCETLGDFGLPYNFSRWMISNWRHWGLW
jgi:hypothetical protein